MNFVTPTDWKSEVWWRKRSVDERLYHMHLPRRIVELGMSADPPSLPFYKNWKPGNSLFIQGPSGSGKSILAAEMLDALIRAHEVSGRWVEADDYIDMLKDSFDNDGLLPEMYSSPHLVKYIKGVFDIVVIDGLGDERLTDFAKHELGSLVRKRHDRMKTTIITSRLSMADVKDRYDTRLASVLADFDLETLGRGR